MEVMQCRIGACRYDAGLARVGWRYEPYRLRRPR